MKKLIIIFFTILVADNSNSQALTENDSLYLTAFEKYSIQLDSFYIKYSKKKGLYSKIYFEQNNLFKGIPTNIHGREIVILKHEKLKKIYKNNHWKLIHLKVVPIAIKSGQIEIRFIPYHGEMDKKGNLSLGISAWTIVNFEYNCDLNKWIYISTKNGGI